MVSSSTAVFPEPVGDEITMGMSSNIAVLKAIVCIGLKYLNGKTWRYFDSKYRKQLSALHEFCGIICF